MIIFMEKYVYKTYFLLFINITNTLSLLGAFLNALSGIKVLLKCIAFSCMKNMRLIAILESLFVPLSTNATFMYISSLDLDSHQRK